MTNDEFHGQAKRFVSVDDFMDLMDKGKTFAEREFYCNESEY